MNTAEKLKQFGFSANEAKAYLGLLRCQPASAYEIAKQTGIPTSKIYETVGKLVARGILQSNREEGSNVIYLAMNPSDLMASIRDRTINETNRLLPELEQIPLGIESNLIWPLLDEAQVQSRTNQLINSTTDTLLVSLWPEELVFCEPALRQAHERGVRIAIVHFGEPDIDIGATYHHPAEKTLYQEKGGRGLTLVGDSREVVIANFSQGGEVEGAWSRNKSFVTVAEDYVKHDVYITKVTRFLNDAVVARFGHDYSQLRDVFNADA